MENADLRQRNEVHNSVEHGGDYNAVTGYLVKNVQSLIRERCEEAKGVFFRAKNTTKDKLQAVILKP